MQPVEEPVNYVYPFNTGVMLFKDIKFQTFGGDLAQYDRLVFSTDGNCSRINFGDPLSYLEYTRLNDTKHEMRIL